MTDPVHIVDLLWAALGLLCLPYPFLRLRKRLHSSSARYFLALVCVLGLYPSLLAIFHLTPFDLGIVYAFTVYVPPLFLCAMSRYLGVPRDAARYWIIASFAATSLIGALALTNRWFGGFALFDVHIPGEPNHLLDHAVAGPGMRAMQALTTIIVLTTVVFSLVQFSRSRFYWPQFLVAALLPALALLSFVSPERWSLLAELEISGFILVTTVTLLIVNYGIASNHFLEVQVITRSRVMALMPDAMVVLSHRGHISDCNPAFEALCRCPARSLISSPLQHHLPGLAAHIEDHATSPFEWDHIDGESAERIYSVTVSHLATRSSQRRQHLVLLRDVTEQSIAQRSLADSEARLRAANEALTRLSNTDPLTGLKNRRCFMDRLESELERLQRGGPAFGLLAIDLDHFKRVNDEHGHEAGDRVLCHIARKLESLCRSADTLARLGGEEFMLLIVNATHERLEQTAERIRSAMSEQQVGLGNAAAVTVTVSVGAVLIAQVSDTATLLRRADDALYQAKRAGRDRWVIA